ncbi:aflatoxin biosynthesis ketoreductase nor-1 [Apiospora saccharicola]|uniref:Aflatoxin biosynthesis ketoreductase nor-1 n=1 Tax=Apiospora saccharicola TaxID=335842 RepID=A0ABR1WD02_9PEZI
MSSHTVVFISGVSRGIGRTLAETYLSKPNHTVIGSTRSGKDADLGAFPAADGSKVILVKIESTTLSDPEAAVKELTAAGVDHVDVVIANAGLSPAVLPPAVADLEDAAQAFTVNTLGPWSLFKALLPLLEKSQNAKWVGITSAVASIGSMEAFGAHVAPAYGISKVGLNWLTFLVQTDSGNRAARLMGMEQAPDTKAKSAESIIGMVEGATKEATSGKMFNAIDGAVIPW